MRKMLLHALLVAIIGFGAVANAKYGGGTGTPEDPYKIATAADLNQIGLEPGDWDKHFILVNDIDLSGYKDTQFNLIGGWYDDPSPNNKPFAGVFDGQGHKIRNFTWTSTGMNGIGLFRTVVYPGQIKNLGMENVKIKTNGGQTVGALVAQSSWTVSACYSTGSISALQNVGGLVGNNQYGAITNCYSTVDIADSWQWIGGLVGRSSGPVMYCYSTGRVAGDSGGFCGCGYDVVSCFWDVETSIQSDSAGGTGKTTAQMMKASTYRGWGACDNEGIWTISEGKDYPHLAWEGKSGGPLPRQQLSDFVPGGGTKADPYRISTAEQLNQIGLFPCEWDKYFVLVDDTDLKGYKDTQFNMIGSSWPTFSGVFDGDGHVIRNFSWTCALERENVGLFSTIGGQVKNLGLENVNIAITGECGGLAGRNHGSIMNCYVTGKVWTSSGLGGCGGLVGYNRGRIDSCYAMVDITGDMVGGLVSVLEENGKISKSYSAGKVSLGRFAGGLVGSANGNTTIENCYSMCSLSDVTEIGIGGGLVGVAGWNQGDSVLIVNCYSTGTVRGTGNAAVGGLVGLNQYGSTILGCFWDTQTSGLLTSAAGTGRTTAQMQTIKTFLDAGWDFVGETANGTDDLWQMPAFKSYPLLSWQEAKAPPGPTFLVEGFENGFGGLGWSFDGSSRWTVVSSVSHSGTHSARAGAIGDDESTSLSVPLDCTAGNLRFWLKVSSEQGFDFLTFSIDGKERGRWSGELDWREVSFAVAAGTRTFTWTYSKDVAGSGGQDTAWIDDIVFPAPSNH
jgi:hypothetical protein